MVYCHTVHLRPNLGEKIICLIRRADVLVLRRTAVRPTVRHQSDFTKFTSAGNTSCWASAVFVHEHLKLETGYGVGHCHPLQSRYKHFVMETVGKLRGWFPEQKQKPPIAQTSKWQNYHLWKEGETSLP